jgi:TetR/AcrR family transcriptional repressor of mexJK operon
LATRTGTATRRGGGKAGGPTPPVRPAGGIWGKTPASQRRRQEILRAAKVVFFEDGYQLASMDRLAAAAGTTKRTLYDHYGNKEALFSATIEFAAEMFVGKLPRVEDLPTDTTEALLSFTEKLASILMDLDAIRFQRAVIAEGEREPAFGRILNGAAFVAAEQVLQHYLAQQVRGGALRPHDVAAWAHAFAGLAVGFDHVQALLGAPEAPADGGDAPRRQIIAMYVRAFGSPGPASGAG